MSNDTEQQTYTLDEAQTELNRRRCSRYGHDWDIQSTMAGPVAVICTSCGWLGKIEMQVRA